MLAPIEAAGLAPSSIIVAETASRHPAASIFFPKLQLDDRFVEVCER